MGAWGPNTFENDVAGDWVSELSETRKLGHIRKTLKAATKSKDDLEDDACCEALAACDAIARLRGHLDPKNSDTESIDEWVKEHPQEVPDELMVLARQAIDRVLAPTSGLRQLWEEQDAKPWLEAVESLRARLDAPKQAIQLTQEEIDREAHQKAMLKPVKSAVGDWFAIPLEGGGYGAVLIFRLQRGRAAFRHALLAALSRRFDTPPTLTDVQGSTIFDIRCMIQAHPPLVGDAWERIGAQPGFSPVTWPLIPSPNGGRYFKWCDNDTLDYVEFRRELVKPAHLRFFKQGIPWIIGSSSISKFIPEVMTKGKQSIAYYEITPTHLKVLEQYKAVIRANRRR